MITKTPNIRAIMNAAISELAPRKVERAIYDGNVPKQHAPYYEVLSKGTMVEYTDKRGEAFEAYFASGLPREIVRIDIVGNRATRTVIERTSAIRHTTAAKAV